MEKIVANLFVCSAPDHACSSSTFHSNMSDIYRAIVMSFTARLLHQIVTLKHFKVRLPIQALLEKRS